jgi:hypothetical protein
MMQSVQYEIESTLRWSPKVSMEKAVEASE